MVTSIGYSLGAGAGIDTKSLIDGLANAAKAPKDALLKKREDANTAKVSALGEAAGAIDGFAAALSKLVSGGTLFTQPTVSDPSLLTAVAVAGADIGELSAQVEVRQLAQSQSLVSANLASATAPVGQGELTLTTGTGSHAITIDASNDSLNGLAKAINDKFSGVTATVIADSNGARLMLKGLTGEANAFTLSVASGAGGGIERFAYDPSASGGMTGAQAAQDAIVRLDGVEVRRGTNSFTDLVAGVQIDLKKAAVGATVSLGIARPTAAISQAVADFVDAYNELQGLLATATAAGGNGIAGGPLRGDTGIRQMQRQLARLTTTELSSAGGFKTLAEIGVATNRDGTLRLDPTKLNDAITTDPKAVESLFNPRQHSSDPAVVITSKINAAKPGAYALTDLVAASGGVGASGKIEGVAVNSTGSILVAPFTSAAKGLIVRVNADVASATVTIDAGLGGALQAVRDALRSADGPFAATQSRLDKEARAIAEDREAHERRSAAYYNQLVTNFTAMDRQVAAFKATQSYMDQQIKMWSGGDD